MDKFIITEGNADTIILITIGFKKNFEKVGTLGEVINRLAKIPTNELGIGFVDNDKNSKGKREETEYNEIKKSAHFGTLVLKYKPKTKNYLIRHPNLEKWLVEMANDLGIDKAKYGVSDLMTNPNRYKKQEVLKNEGFRNFINALANKPNSPLQTVKIWIEELKKEYGVF